MSISEEWYGFWVDVLLFQTERVSEALSEKNVCVAGAKSEDLVASKASQGDTLLY